MFLLSMAQLVYTYFLAHVYGFMKVLFCARCE